MITGNSASNPKFRFKPLIPLTFTSIPVKMENHWLHITVGVWVDYKNLIIVMIMITITVITYKYPWLRVNILDYDYDWVHNIMSYLNGKSLSTSLLCRSSSVADSFLNQYYFFCVCVCVCVSVTDFEDGFISPNS